MPNDSPIDFGRDNAWIAQITQGDGLLASEYELLWLDLMTCYYLAQTFPALVDAADERLARLEAENAALRQTLAQTERS